MSVKFVFDETTNGSNAIGRNSSTHRNFKRWVSKHDTEIEPNIDKAKRETLLEAKQELQYKPEAEFTFADWNTKAPFLVPG